MKLDLELGVAGRYKLEAFHYDEAGNEVRRELTPWFDNLITDGGLDLIGSSLAPIAYCHVGTGNATPQFTDSTLQSFLASTATFGPGSVNGAIVAGPPRYGYKRAVYRFSPGQATGNLSEVGVGPAAAGALFSRALILDAGGNPTTITILPIEYLDVVYEIRLYVPTADVVTNVTISGVVYTVTRRALEGNSPSYWAEFLPAARSGSNSNWWSQYAQSTGMVALTAALDATYWSILSTAAYVAGTHYIERTGTYSITEANFNINVIGIRSAIGAFQFGFSPAIPKDNTKTLTMTYRIHWTRH